jgi:NhaP-type Na+/H+ or K+/H+ antiporter
MFWQFLIAAIAAIAFIQLGAMAVWVSVLWLVLKGGLVLLVAAALCVAWLYVWRRYRVVPAEVTRSPSHQ